jgi:HK97 gp10 family phage protein
MSYTFKDNTDEVLSAFARAKHRGLEAIGMAAETNAKKYITRLVYTRAKGKHYAYKLTGRLRNSITYAISGYKAHLQAYRADRADENGILAVGRYDGQMEGDADEAVYIGTNVEYGPFVEDGTRRMAARPFIKPAAANHGEEYKKLMQASMENAE